MSENVIKGCPKCGRTLDASLNECPYCHYEFAALNTYFNKFETQRSYEADKFAGFLKRVIAFLIDAMFIGLIIGLFYVLDVTNKIDLNLTNDSYLIIFSVILILYKIILEGAFSATLGKMFVGIKIVNNDAEEGRIAFATASLRNFAVILDILTVFIGYLLILFTKNRVALHDMVAKTIVINKEEALISHDYAPGIMRLIAFIIDCAVIACVYYLLMLGLTYIYDNYIIGEEILLYRNYIKYGIVIVFTILYFTISESGSSRCSLGKKMIGMKIQDYNGNKIGFMTSLLRLIFIIVEIPTLGFLLCLVSRKKQTLKDKFASTVVVRK